MQIESPPKEKSKAAPKMPGMASDKRQMIRRDVRAEVEDWLWISLPAANLLNLYLCKTPESPEMLSFLMPSAWSCFLQCLFYKIGTSKSSSTRGNLTAMALVPSLVHTIAMAQILDSSFKNSRRWLLYSYWTVISSHSFVWIGEKSAIHMRHCKMLYSLLVIMAIAHCLTLSAVVRFLATFETLEWILLHILASQQHRFFVKNSYTAGKKQSSTRFQMATWGEYQTLVFLLVLGVLEWQAESLHLYGVDPDIPRNKDSKLSYSLVAQSGIIGCLLSVILVALLSRHLSLASKLVLQVAMPLCTVELSLRQFSNYIPPLTNAPHCLQWLLSFFLAIESSSQSWPRYWGLLYWGIALIILATPTVCIVQGRQSVVITRKWFHLVAVVLFAPTTRFFPQLMALGYAVSLCVLLVMESIRHATPFLNDFYCMVHDPTKDKSEGIIISHICLLLGCAAPLWISQAMDLDHQLLPQWGVLCLGVGDAMGAVIGKTYGRTPWGENNRTIEGSLAMWISMLVIGIVVTDQWKPLLVATTFATLLEAYTVQMDNLVLPLAGSLWIVMLSG